METCLICLHLSVKDVAEHMAGVDFHRTFCMTEARAVELSTHIHGQSEPPM